MNERSKPTDDRLQIRFMSYNKRHSECRTYVTSISLITHHIVKKVQRERISNTEDILTQIPSGYIYLFYLFGIWQVQLYQNSCFHFANQREFARLLVLVSYLNWSKRLRKTNMWLGLRERSSQRPSTCRRHR